MHPSWLSSGKATRISHGRNPIRTVQLLKKKRGEGCTFGIFVHHQPVNISHALFILKAEWLVLMMSVTDKEGGFRSVFTGLSVGVQVWFAATRWKVMWPKERKKAHWSVSFYCKVALFVEGLIWHILSTESSSDKMSTKQQQQQTNVRPWVLYWQVQHAV